MLAAHAVWDYVNTHPSRPRPVTVLDEYAKWYDRFARAVDLMIYADPKYTNEG